jgi:hypothetical protein
VLDPVTRNSVPATIEALIAVVVVTKPVQRPIDEAQSRFNGTFTADRCSKRDNAWSGLSSKTFCER